jgi:hypothetical protein
MVGSALHKRFAADASYLNSCRRKRNELSYEFVGAVTEAELSELLRKVPAFQKLVEEWLRERYPDPVG